MTASGAPAASSAPSSPRGGTAIRDIFWTALTFDFYKPLTKRNNLSRAFATTVPYKGASPALQDLLGGQVASTVGVLGIALPHIQAGNLRALAMTGATRSSFLPDVPTLTEAGFFGLEITEWQGLFVPAKTPPAVVHALNRSVRDALDTAEVKAGLIKLSFEAGGTSPEQFADIVKADIARWEPIVKASGFTPEN